MKIQKEERTTFYPVGLGSRLGQLRVLLLHGNGVNDLGMPQPLPDRPPSQDFAQEHPVGIHICCLQITSKCLSPCGDSCG